MTWLAPWALTGLVAVAVPLLVHWLARHQADRHPFPAVRFLPMTPPTSVRRHRLTDVGLLAVRAAIAALAALALAQPAWPSATPAADPVRAIVRDTSASLGRALADGRSGVTAAAMAVETLRQEPAREVLVIDAADLRHGVAQATGWLRLRGGAADLVVVSDFQVGAMAEADLDGVPPWSGVRLVPIEVDGPVPAVGTPGGVRVHGAPRAEAAARAVVDGASAPDPAAAPALVIAFPGAPERAALEAGAQPLDGPADWELVRRVGGTGVDVPAMKVPGTAVVLLPDMVPDSLEAADLIARALTAVQVPAVGFAELEPDRIDPVSLTAWNREGRAELAPSSGVPEPRHRWLWTAVLALLALETWMRRTRPSAVATPSPEVADARVA